MISLLNNQSVKNANQAIRLLKTDFSDVSLGTPYQVGGPRNYWQDVNGPDTSLIKSYMGDATKLYIQNLPDVDCADVTALQARLYNNIEASTKPGGASDLRSRILAISVNPQLPLLLYRYPSSAPSISELPSIYYKYDFYLQPDLIARLSPSGWCSFSEIKEGDKNLPNGGGFRIKNIILYSGGSLKWQIGGDNLAGLIGNPAYPPGSGDPTYPVESGFTEYWINDPAKSGEVPLGEWCTFHLEYIRPKARADITSGRYTVAIERADGSFQLLHHQEGGLMSGALFQPMNRIFLSVPYSNGNPTIDKRITNLEVWTRAPFNMTAHLL